MKRRCSIFRLTWKNARDLKKDPTGTLGLLFCTKRTPGIKTSMYPKKNVLESIPKCTNLVELFKAFKISMRAFHAGFFLAKVARSRSRPPKKWCQMNLEPILTYIMSYDLGYHMFSLAGVFDSCTGHDHLGNHESPTRHIVKNLQWQSLALCW